MPGMVPEDVYELTTVSDPRLSPDGRLVAFVVTRIDREESEYRSAIWLMRTDGSGEPRPLTSGVKVDAAPRFSPDGTRLAFVSNRDGGKKQLYVLPLEGGEPRRLSDLPEDVEDPSWSPDSQQLVFASRVPDAAYEEENERRRPPRRFRRLQFKFDNEGWTGDRRRHLFIAPADGSAEPRQLTSGDFENSHPSWSPDGRRIVFVSSRGDDWDLDPVAHLFIIAPEGGEPEQLTSGESIYSVPTWSPDGRLIACRWSPGGFDRPRHERAAVVDAETGEHRSLSEDLDRHGDSYPPLRTPAWDGDEVVFGVEDGGNVPLYRARADGSQPPQLAVGGERWVNGWDAAAGELVYTASTPTSLSELYRGDRQLTSFGADFAEGRELVSPERFTATSPGGTEVEAWIIRPAGFREGTRYPVLLNIHGGPFTQYGNKFFDEFQVYAGAGYAVVYSNPRGSSGYSEEWGRAIRGPVDGGPGWGSLDYDDVMAVMDEALRRFDFCDPERLGVMGGSYGGYMTSWIVGHTDRFAAACSERAVNSLVSQYGSSDIGHFLRSYMGAYLYEDLDAYVRHSPVTYATEMTTPLLILHSENDLRCNVEQAEQLFTTLRLLRRDVEFVRFPAEGHELTRSGSPAHRVQRFEVLLDWFGRKLVSSGS
jgi:dipeptidyl aminopeptidase/acylaminoacyl peptidase